MSATKYTNNLKFERDFLRTLGLLVQEPASHYRKGRTQSTFVSLNPTKPSHLEAQRMILGAKEFPFCTTRRIDPRLAWEEMSFFLRGQTQTKELEAVGVKFWIENTTREFLDKRGLTKLPEGDMGKAYGWQWRSVPGNDQLRTLVEQLVRARMTSEVDRRMMVMLWNPTNLSQMALTPCWYGMQAHVRGRRLDFVLNNRSLDLTFGFWFAVMQYRMFQIALCTVLDFDLGIMDLRLGDVHLYESQLEWAQEWTYREPIQVTPSVIQNTISLPKRVPNLFPNLDFLDKITRDIVSDSEIHDAAGMVTCWLEDLQYSDWEIDYRVYNADKFTTPRPKMEA